MENEEHQGGSGEAGEAGEAGEKREQRSPSSGELGAGAVSPEVREQRRRGRKSRGAGNKDPASSRVASAQSGVITHEQLTQTGLSTSAIGRRAQNGALHRRHRGVYLVGHEALAPLARETAALLACGDGAVISHISAAVVWGMVPAHAAGEEVHVTLQGRRLRSRPGLRVHRSSHVETRRRENLRVTSPAQTLLDLAADRSPHLHDALSEAHAHHLLRKGELEAFVKRAKGRPGAPVLRAVVEASRTGYTRSRAERIMRKLARAAGLPQPLVNHHLNGYLVDFLWPEQRLIVEVDGFGFHGHRRAFETDRRRDAVHVATGYRVIRVTWLQLTTEPFAVVANVARALAA